MFLIFLRDPVYEHSYELKTCVYWIFKCMFLILFSNYCHARKSIPITEDDNILKNHKKFFSYQGWMLKYLPSTETVYKSIKNTIKYQGDDYLKNINYSEGDDSDTDIYDAMITNINMDITRKFQVAEKVIDEDSKILNNQKFKNIKINNGSNPYYLYFLLHYLVFIDIPFILISSVLSLFEFNQILSFGYIFACILNILVMILFPWLNYKCLKSNTIFGDE